MKKGFTILELVIVISVLVILIGIAIPRFKGMQQSGQLAKAKAELQTLQSAMESYYSNASPNAYFQSTTSPAATYLTAVTPQIISSSLPYDPFAAVNTEYDEVTDTSSGKYYVFGSIGTGASLGTLAINSAGAVTKATGNLCVTNGTGC